MQPRRPRHHRRSGITRRELFDRSVAVRSLHEFK